MTGAERGKGPLLGAVLAGGRSSRFGTDKALASADDERLLDRAVRILGMVCDEVIIVSSRPGHEAPGATRISDRRQGLGPLAGLETALAHGRTAGAAAVFVLACDMPSVDAVLVRRLIEALGDGPAAAPARGGAPGFEPLCAAYATSCLAAATRLLDDGRRDAAALFDEVGGRVADPPGSGLVNVNTRADLEAWSGRPATAAQAPGRAPTGERPTVVCVIGKKKSGKTTTVVGLVAELVARGREVVTVKHGHGFVLDREGTDSWKHRHEGGASRVVVAGPDEFAVMGRWSPRDGGTEPSLEALVARFASDADVVVAEGFKAAGYPCIEVYRSVAHARPLLGDPSLGGEGRWVAVLTDDRSFEATCPVLDIDDPERFRVLADLVQGRA